MGWNCGMDIARGLALVWSTTIFDPRFLLAKSEVEGRMCRPRSEFEVQLVSGLYDVQSLRGLSIREKSK